jgi:hypothetical protein
LPGSPGRAAAIDTVPGVPGTIGGMNKTFAAFSRPGPAGSWSVPVMIPGMGPSTATLEEGEGDHDPWPGHRP